MAINPLYNNSLANLYRTIGQQRGVSPAFVNASIAQGISESSLNPGATGDNGLARGLHQWHPDRYQGLMALSQKMGLPPTDPRVQINHWYDENQKNLGIGDPRAANDAAIGSERPAGWKPGDPTGVPSYNKRLGDTLAMMRLANGQPDPQDPRSFVASAPDGAPQANPEVPPQAQSISLGSEEDKQPFNNLGSTLANMGASIASLDRRGTGIASLNASKVASNLSAQELARQKEVGWKYAGQTQNGQGLIFQNSKGDMRVEPLNAGFSGQKEPETIRTLKALQADPSLMETLKEKSADTKEQQQGMLNDDGRKSVVEDYIAGNDGAFRNLNKADVAGAQNMLADFKNKYGITSEDIMGNRGKWRGVFGAEREYSKRIANVSSAEASLSAAIGQGRDLLKDPEVKSMLNNPRLLNQFNQFLLGQTNGEGLGKLAKLKENFETVAQDYTRVNSMGGATTTVSAQDIARGILNTGMSDKAINELFDYMGQTGLRVKGALEAGQEELRTNARKHTKIEDYQKSQSASEKAISDRLEKDMVKFGLKPKSTIKDDSGEPAAPKASAMTREAYDKLPSGAKYTDPNGVERIKK